MSATAGPARPAASLYSRAAVIVTAMMFGLTYSLAATLIALDLSKRGLSETLIGANAAMHALGVLATAMVLARIVALFGIRRLMILALGMAAVTLLAFPVVPLIWLWFPLRFFLGAAAEVLFVLSEAWTSSLSTEATRARWMAAYTASNSIGFALGPVTLALVGSGDYVPYLLGAGISALAAALIASPKVEAPVFSEPAEGTPLRFMRLAPVAMFTTGLNAAVETAGLSFLAIYAMSFGWSEEGGVSLISCMMIGAILLQLPIGWLGDTMDRMKLLIALAVIAALGALTWPFVLGGKWVIYPLLFVWGGAFVGIYTLMLTVVGSRFKGAELIGIYAAMGLVWGGGALGGPLLAGLAMDASPHGLAYFVAGACALFAIFAAIRGKSST